MTLTVAAFAIVGCMHGETPGQRATKPTTAVDRSIETTVVKDPAVEPTTSVLVKGSNVTAARAAVRAVRGEVTHELGIINAVGAQLTPLQLRRLEANGSLRMYADRSTEVAGLSQQDRRAAAAARRAVREAEKVARASMKAAEKAAEKARKLAEWASKEAQKAAERAASGLSD